MNANSIDSIAKLKSNGDLVEQQCADRIAAALPSYARIWVEFVGNDGHAQALPMVGVADEVVFSREKHWQRVYTILESLVLCWEIEGELHETTEIKSFKNYAQNLNLWMAFYSHMGRIHDMVKAVAGELDRPDLLQPFDEYWKDRHVVLHGPKVPLKWVFHAIAIPAFGQMPKGWNDKMMWSDLKAGDFKLISEEVTTVLRELEARLDRCLAELRKVFADKCGWKPISWNVADTHYDMTQQIRANMSMSSSAELVDAKFIYPSGASPLNTGVINE